MLVVGVRLSVNLATPSIEFVVSKMRSANLQQLEQIRKDMANLHVPRRVTCALDGLYNARSHADPSWFNVANNFREATQSTIELGEEAFAVLSSEELWKNEVEVQPGDLAKKMRKAAELCATSGEEEAALRLLRMASRRPTVSAERERKALPLFALYAHTHKSPNERLRAMVGKAAGEKDLEKDLPRDGSRFDGSRFYSVVKQVKNNTSMTTQGKTSASAMRRTYERLCPNFGKEEVWRLDLALPLLEVGLPQPWPRTLVKVSTAAGEAGREAKPWLQPACCVWQPARRVWQPARRVCTNAS